MRAPFHCLSDDGKLACNFCYSAVGPGLYYSRSRPPPKFPGKPSPLCPRMRPHFTASKYSHHGTHGGTGEQPTPATTDRTASVSLPATTDQAETAIPTTNRTPKTAETKAKVTTKVVEQGTSTRTAAATPTARRASTSSTPAPPSPPPTHTSNNTTTKCQTCSTSPQDSSDSDRQRLQQRQLQRRRDAFTTKRERLERFTSCSARSRSPTKWQDIVMDRTAWNKVLRSIYTYTYTN
jgi:hypothetical protein